MNKLERLFIGLLLGAILPISGFLAGWWSFSQYSSNVVIGLAAFSGLAAGLLVDAFFLKKWIARAYQGNSILWMAVFLFYSICVFGFFMGVPVFNLALAVPAGIFTGAKKAHIPLAPKQEQQLTRRTQLFTTLVMSLICAASAFLALRDPTTAANLEGMLRLPFRVTQPMIVALIVVGGSILLLLQWQLTAKFEAVGRSLAARPA